MKAGAILLLPTVPTVVFGALALTLFASLRRTASWARFWTGVGFTVLAAAPGTTWYLLSSNVDAGWAFAIMGAMVAAAIGLFGLAIRVRVRPD